MDEITEELTKTSTRSTSTSTSMSTTDSRVGFGAGCAVSSWVCVKPGDTTAFYEAVARFPSQVLVAFDAREMTCWDGAGRPVP